MECIIRDTAIVFGLWGFIIGFAIGSFIMDYLHKRDKNKENH